MFITVGQFCAFNFALKTMMNFTQFKKINQLLPNCMFGKNFGTKYKYLQFKLVLFILYGLFLQTNATAQTCAPDEYWGVSASGYATSVFSENSVGNSSQALGEPILVSGSNSYYAKLDNDADFLVLGFGNLLTAGTTVQVFWGTDDANTATLQIQESFNGSTFSNLQSFTTSVDLNDNNPQQVIASYTLLADTNYLRFARATGAGKPGINGVFYEIFDCLSAYPIAVNDNAQAYSNTLVNIDVQGNDSDPQNLALTTTIVTPPANGTAVVQANGSINYTSNVGFTGIDIIEYQICNNYNGGLCATAFAYVAVGSADLSITKSVSNSQPSTGSLINYTLSVTNLGPNEATNIEITDVLPSGVTHVSNNSAGTYSPATGNWNIASLLPNATATLNITVTVTAARGTVITNTASITTLDQIETNAANNVASITFTVTNVDIQITKTVSAAPYNENVNLTYTVNVRNNGPDVATGIQVKDLLSSSLTFVSATPAQGTYNAITGIWDVGTLTSGSNRNLTIVAYPETGTSGTAINNTASLFHLDQIDTNNANNSAAVEIEVATVDLLLEKSVNDNTPSVGQEIEFSLKLTNLGPGIGTNIIIEDVLPDGLTFTSISSLPAGSTAVHSGGTVSWTIPSRTVGNMTLKFKATVDAGWGARSITNTAYVEDFDQVDPVRANNTSSISMLVNGADLAVTKTVNNIAPNPGDPIIYTIVVTNLGPLASNDVIIEDILPSGVTYVSSSADESSYLTSNNRWGSTGNLDLGIGETRTLTINATVNAGTIGNSYLNTATIVSAAQPDGITDNNSASALIAIGEADLGVTKTASAPADGIAFFPGEQVTYTIQATNYGPHNAPLVTVTDLLPSTLTFVSASATVGSYNNVNGVWDIGSLNTGVTQTLTLIATVNSGETTAGKLITNTATVSSPMNEPVSASQPNTANASIQVHGADLAITKTQTIAASYLEGDPLNYTVTVTNNGPDDATGIQVTDLLPINLQLNTVTASEGTYTQATGIWSGISLLNGESATLTFNTTIKSGGGITNIARITASDQGDSNTDNNTATVFISALKNFDAGACIISMNSPTEITLKAYGLVYEIVKIAQVPVYWAIRPDKTFGSETSKVDEIDFSVNGVDYYTGAFIIDRAFLADAQPIIDQWIADYPLLANIINCNQPAFTAPIHAELTSFPRAVLDEANGSIAEAFFYDKTGLTNTQIGVDGNGEPIYSLYRPDGTPLNLDVCDDIYVMPHADPHQWTNAEKENFDNFVRGGGWIWLACHAVSSLEGLVDLPNDPAPAPDATYLSVAGLIEWGDHSDGTPPYSYSLDPAVYASEAASDPFMQFLGTIDGALESGSESIYVPLSEGWRPTTTVAIWDPDFYAQTGEGSPDVKAAKLAYGHAFGNPDYGMVMYEASHSIQGGTEAEDVGAARVYGNFWFQAGVDFRPEIVPTNIPVDIQVGEAGLFSADVFGQVATSTTFTYEWLSNCSGTFSDPTAASTYFTPDPVDEPTECIVRLIVIDECGRQNFLAKTYIVYPKTDLSVEKTAPATIIAGEDITYSITVNNLGPKKGIDVQVEDILPAGLTYVSSTASVGSYDSGTSIWTIGEMQPNTSETITIVATVGSDVTNGTEISNTAHVSSLSFDKYPENDTSTALTTVQTFADLVTVKTLSSADANPAPGDSVTFTITVTNNGPSDAINVSLTDLMPAGLTLTASNPSAGK